MRTVALAALLIAGTALAQTDVEAERQRKEAEWRKAQHEAEYARMRQAHCEHLARELQVIGARNTPEDRERRAERFRAVEAKQRELGCRGSEQQAR